MNRRIVLIFIAFVISVGVFLLIRQWMQAQIGAHAGPAAAVAARYQVLIAAKDIAQGDIVAADAVRWEAWPNDKPPAEFLVQGRAAVTDVAGAVARVHISPGQPMSAGLMIKPGDRGYMAAVLGPGMRAVTINVNANTGLAGFLAPGDHVDLLVTLTVGGAGRDSAARHVTETLLTNLRVVGVDQLMTDQRRTDKKDSSPPKTVTLEATPKQVEMIEVAADMGVLALSAHSVQSAPGEAASPAVTHTWDAEAAPGIPLGGAPEPPASPVAAKAAGAAATVNGAAAARRAVGRRLETSDRVTVVRGVQSSDGANARISP